MLKSWNQELKIGQKIRTNSNNANTKKERPNCLKTNNIKHEQKRKTLLINLMLEKIKFSNPLAVINKRFHEQVPRKTAKQK